MPHKDKQRHRNYHVNFEYNGRRYEAAGRAVIESGPGVDGRLLVEDIAIRHLGDEPGAAFDEMLYQAAWRALVKYWRDHQPDYDMKEERRG